MRKNLLLRTAMTCCLFSIFMVTSMAQIVTNQSRETIFDNTIFISEPEYGVNNFEEGTLYSNGPFYNQPGSPNKSVLQGTDLLMSTFGAGHAQTSGFRVADDWVVTNPVSVESFQFYSYQTGSTTTSTINFLSLAIWNGVPGEAGSSIVWGSQTTNAYSSSTWSGVYRVLDTFLDDTSRPIMITTVNTPGLTLEPGTYWLDWQTGGTLASGPWAPPIAIWGMTTTGNAKQFNPTTGLWTNLEDVGPQGLPFEVNGMEILDGCTNSPNGQWPSSAYSPSCAGTEQTITSSGFTGEYSRVNVLEGNQYVFRVSNSAHFITITNNDDVILATGTGTVNWTATMSGTIKFFHHLSSACDFASNIVSRFVTCTPEPPTPCTMDTINSYPFTETFEQSSPSRQCWTNEYVSGTSNWNYVAGAVGGAITTAYGGSGLNARFQQANANQDITKLVSPKFVFSNFENASLSFYYGNQEWLGDQNELRVYYKTSASGAWTMIPGAEFTTNVNAWTLATFDLPESDLADEYYIAFEGLNEWGYGVVVDQIVVDATEVVIPGCLNGTLYPSSTFNPACTGNPESITTIAYAGEYSNVNLTAGVEYTFSIGNGTDYITIANSTGTTILASGTTPVTYTPSTNGIVRFYNHVSAGCETESSSRSKFVQCGEPFVFDDPDYDCYQGDGEISALENGYGILATDIYRVADDFTVDPGTEFTLRQVTMSFLSSSGIPSATFGIHADNAGLPGSELHNFTLTPSYNEVYGTAFGFNGHRVEFELTTPITLGEGTYWLNVTTPNQTYWVTTTTGTSGSLVALSNTSGGSWELDSDGYRTVFYVEGDCEEVTEEPVEGCLDTPNGQWGSLTPACSGAPELVTSIAYTGEYSNITVTAGTQYIFSSSVNTDFITIANADGSVAYAAGVTPLTWTATGSEVVRFIMHNNSDCEYDNTSRSKFVQCGTILPPPANDDCANAIAVACGDTVTGATTFATNSGGNIAGDVFYKFTGTGAAQMVNLSLCNSSYDTAIRVFTDCTLATEIAYNDDSCGVQSEVSFLSDGTSTYYIMVEGWSSSTGNYEMNVTCSEPPTYDPCAPVHEGVATNGVGFVNNGTDNYMAANDFNVLANTQFEVEKFTINVVTLGGEPTTFDLKFFEGDTAVGAQFGETLTNVTPSSITENGTFGSTGYPVYSVEITLPNSIVFPATLTADKKYWVGISGMPTGSGNAVYWVSSDYVYTNTLPTWQSPDGGITWAVFVAGSGANVEGDMIIDGECATLGLSDMNNAQFSYYPNPVKDVLNITSSKGVEKVEVFNLAGQSVMLNGKLANGQINVSTLSTGTYVFRVTLEGGQIETFKIVKK